ncbi:alpha/beta fold hydrolase [Rhizobium sp. SYY.PMSO]|uniref:alpha/beta fold hydrolase n=1 Tax=Rhizobium sp. SYY.PMSO TaxID=3382192 RepID=UPI00398FBBEB
MTSVLESRPAGHRRRVKTADGIELEVREWGDPNGPELLLVTGVAQSYLSFVKQYSAPEMWNFRIISFDPRGHGLSDKPFGDEWYQDGKRWSGEVQSIIDVMELHKPILVGWSLGGRIVRQYLVDYGDTQLSGVGFLSCRPVEVPEVIGPGNDVVQKLDIDDLGSRIDITSAFLRNCFGLQPDADEFAFALGYNMVCPFEIRQQIGKWWTEPAISEAALRRVTVPTLIVHGRDDILVLPDAADITARLIPHATLSLYDGCGHSVFFEAAERFNAELRDFVKACSDPAAALATAKRRTMAAAS